MRFRLCQFGVPLALALSAGATVVPIAARADANIQFNFNQPNGKQQGWFPVPDPTVTGSITPFWDWNLGPSGTGGGWQVYTGTNAALSAASLVSPCLVLGNNKNSDWVSVEITHRFNFPTVPILPSGSSANLLGQVQYRVASGGTTPWGSWLGVPNAYFVDENLNPVSGNVLPSYPPPLFGPLIESGTVIVSATSVVDPVNAWAGTTLDFASGFESKSVFTLPYATFSLALDDEIQFRFVVATDQSVSGTTELAWEINSVQVKGAKLCVVPEPAALALAGIGGLGCVFLVRRRHRSWAAQAARAVAGSTAVTIVVVVAVVWALAAAPARAQSTWWDFQVSSGAWTTSGTRAFDQPTSSQHEWKWVTSSTVAGGTSPHWQALAQGVSASTPSVYYLTSPLVNALSGTVPATTARISIAQEYLFKMGTSGRPIATGQVQYRLNGSSTWLGLPLSAFTTGSVFGSFPPFGPSPFDSGSNTLLHVDRSTFVTPTYTTPTGTAALPFIVPGASSFTGTTPGWPSAYVPTQAILSGALVPAEGISSLQLRFANLNLASTCNCGSESWNLRFVEVDFPEILPPVPEPAGIALGSVGLAVLAARGAFRRLRHQRPSSPSVMPCATTLPDVSVRPTIGFSGQSTLARYWAGASANPPSQKIA